jgi:hypothetical protein
VAVIVAVIDEPTGFVVMLKVVAVLPAATVTVVGTVAKALLLDKDTERPPLGAAPLSVTVPVADVPPVRLVGVIESEERETVAAGLMVSVAVLLTLL